MPTVKQVIEALSKHPEDSEVLCSHSTGILFVKTDGGMPQRAIDFQDQYAKYKQKVMNPEC